MTDADVVVVGYGPVGAALALRLRQLGMSVVVVERTVEAYPLPRAVAADGEVWTLLHRLDPSLVEGFVSDREVRFASRGRTLATLRFPSWYDAPGLSFLSQPALEGRLRALGAEAGVEVLPGQVVALRGTDGTSGREGGDRSGASGTGRQGVVLADGTEVTGSWVVGCDGAGSTTRSLLGVPWRGRDLPGTWLVADVAWRGRDRFTYTLDPDLPQVDMPTPEGHRWEWLGASVDDLPRLLARDGCEGAEVLRAVPYAFGARRATRWSVGRVLLAGDAAHVMPPFAGQGLGAGLRDAWAVAALLASGPRPEQLPAYQALREPHVRQMTRLSLLLGRLVTARHAGARDALLSAAFRAPGLGPWLQRGGPRPADSHVLAR